MVVRLWFVVFYRSRICMISLPPEDKIVDCIYSTVNHKLHFVTAIFFVARMSPLFYEEIEDPVKCKFRPSERKNWLLLSLLFSHHACLLRGMEDTVLNASLGLALQEEIYTLFRSEHC